VAARNKEVGLDHASAAGHLGSQLLEVRLAGSVLCARDGVYITPRWEPQEEGMMSTAASLPSVVKPRFIEPVGESQTSEG
jgi:hypothetical protein